LIGLFYSDNETRRALWGPSAQFLRKVINSGSYSARSSLFLASDGV
jgi:hypothetical protein